MVGMIIRFVVSALVLMVLSFVLPGFQLFGFMNALVAAIAIAVIGFLVESLFGESVSTQARGLVGFFVAALVIWGTQFLVPAMQVSVIGALLASLAIGIIDAFVPTALR